MPRRPVRFARQILALQIGLVVLVVGAGFGVAAALLDRNLENQYGLRALSVARATAADPDLVRAAAGGRSDPRVQERAEHVRTATGALFIVVTDARGIRLSHPEPSKIGAPVSTDPSDVLAGREVTEVDRGTLGYSARGKVPLRAADGTVVGQVSVGFDADDIDTAFLRLLGTSGLFTGAALLLGVSGAALLTRLLKRRTLGLEPDELAGLVRQREAVLYGIGEGVLAVDARGRVSVANAEAERLLGVELAAGTAIADVDLPARLRAVLAERRSVDNLITVAGDRVLVVGNRLVRRDGIDLGSVLSLRDRTDLELLGRELESVRGMSDALRAQRHEFSNRLHTLSGLLQTGHHREAVEYLQALSTGSTVSGLGAAAEAVRDPYLVAFLSAKKSSAAEKGVDLELGETSWVESPVTHPVEITTVVGNLVDNACEAAQLGARSARVEVDLLSEADVLHVSVLDSGDGVLRPDRIFTEGHTSKEEGRGLGLSLAAQAARSLGGEVWLADAGGDEHGAVFVARLPGTLEPRTDEPRTADEQEARS